MWSLLMKVMKDGVVVDRATKERSKKQERSGGAYCPECGAHVLDCICPEMDEEYSHIGGYDGETGAQD
jgi:hypothetical protein